MNVDSNAFLTIVFVIFLKFADWSVFIDLTFSEMPLKIEFVFLTEGCQLLKFGLFDGHWPKTFNKIDQMKLENEEKTNLMVDGSEVECVCC